MSVKGVYVHIPFCSYKCPYCDFMSVTTSPIGHEEYLELLIRELNLYRQFRTNIETLYLGGGTPTLLDIQLIARFLEALDRVLGLGSLKEFTVEANPETVNYRKLKELKALGVNRLSIGVQSFLGKGLALLGRKHSVEDSIRAFQCAREAGFDNINIDLIYAYPSQREEDMEKELEVIGRLKPDHVSAYMLTPYEGTPLGIEVSKGSVILPDEEELVKIYNRLWTGLKEMGYRRYEISNWSVEGMECKHNLLYWNMKEFLGLGVSAWGYIHPERYGNTKNLFRYREAVVSGQRPIERREILSEREAFKESLILKLRLKKGLRGEDRKLIPAHLMQFFEESLEGMGIKEEYMLLANEIICEVLMYNSV